MDINDLVLYSESLYKIAYHKMNNTTDADELAQETLLQALIELRKNPDKVIINAQAWLNGILNNCFYTMMRKKYKTAYVTYDVIIDNYLAEDNINEFIENEETSELYSNIKRSVSALAKIHRDVIHLFYMNNKSVNEIAETLDIPRGTVLSRLDNGRKIIKKGVLNMSNNIMYKPQKLKIGISGRTGYNNEPFSSVSTSIHQNILINAYEKPVTESELSEIMGIPCVYIEEMVENLIGSELMKRTSGGKVYTDFQIKFDKNRVVTNKNMLNIVNDNFELVWAETSNMFEKICKLDFVMTMSECQKNKLLIFVGIKLFNDVIYKIRVNYHNCKFVSFNEFPDRLHNGKWLANGWHYGNEDILAPYKKFDINGMINNDFDYKGVHVKRSFFESSLCNAPVNEVVSFMLTKEITSLLYDIKFDDISSYNEKYVKEIQNLCERGLLTRNGDIIKVDIPTITYDDEKNIYKIIENNENIYNILKESVMECFAKENATLPVHLRDSVPKEFLTIGCDVLMTGFLVTAKEKGLFLKDVDYPCPAMVFIC